MKLFYIDTENRQARIVEVEQGDNELQQFYDLIRCNYVEYHEFDIGGKTYDIICDEEFLINGKELVPSVAQDLNGKPWALIFGSILIANHDGEGNTVGLTDDDIVNIMDNGFCCLYGEVDGEEVSLPVIKV